MLKKRWKAFVKVLVNNKNIVTFLSASTVLASFVLKDVWDERLKELSAAINTAADRSEKLNANFYFSRRLFVIQRGISDLGSLIANGGKPSLPVGPSEALDKGRAEWLSSNEYRFFAEMTDLRAYVKVLPRHKYYDRATIALAGRMENYEKRASDLGKGHDAAFQGSLATEFGGISDATDALAGEAFTEGRDTLEWSEKWHKICVWAIYSLFAAGWVLGLIANFAGVKVGAKE